MKTVEIGDVFIQDNQERRFGADLQYAVLWVKLLGDEEPKVLPLIMTNEELNRCIARAEFNFEDVPELGNEAAINNFDGQ